MDAVAHPSRFGRCAHPSRFEEPPAHCAAIIGANHFEGKYHGVQGILPCQAHYTVLLCHNSKRNRLSKPTRITGSSSEWMDATLCPRETETTYGKQHSTMQRQLPPHNSILTTTSVLTVCRTATIHSNRDHEHCQTNKHTHASSERLVTAADHCCR